MTGTNGDIIAIVIVPLVILIFWLGMIFYANSHPRWGSQAPADADSAYTPVGGVPTQRLSRPGPVVPGHRPGTATGEVTSEQARTDETRK